MNRLWSFCSPSKPCTWRGFCRKSTAIQRSEQADISPRWRGAGPGPVGIWNQLQGIPCLHAAPIQAPYASENHWALVHGLELAGDLHMQLDHGRIHYAVPVPGPAVAAVWRQIYPANREPTNAASLCAALSAASLLARLTRMVADCSYRSIRTTAAPARSVRIAMQSRHHQTLLTYDGDHASNAGGRERCGHRGPQVRLKTERQGSTRVMPSCSTSFPGKPLPDFHRIVVLPTRKEPEHLCQTLLTAYFSARSQEPSRFVSLGGNS